MSKETCPKCKRESLETRPNRSTYCLYATDCGHFGSEQMDDWVTEAIDTFRYLEGREPDPRAVIILRAAYIKLLERPTGD